ncbi:lyase family protein [Agromyces sp. MMS24-JH15]|uniref:lyase family protein n=1 Tax=Agromyces sp. MMS24-JH15 TaxID=3243765 RepID=UPI0037497A29
MTAFDWGLLEPLGGDDGCSDDAVLAALVEVERALVVAWGGLVGEDLTALAAALDPEAIDRARLPAGARAGGVPVIDLVAQLREHAEDVVGASARWVHRGATSQDVLDSALVVVAKRALAGARADLADAGDRLAGLADAERGTLAIARTLGQHAEPTTFGATIAGWLDGVASAIEALDRASFPVQLGGAVGTGAAFVAAAGRADATARLRAGVARELGLDDPGRAWHVDRAPVVVIADEAALVAGALGRIGRDLAFLARTEVGEVHLASTGGSSAMPHKRNPVDAVLLTANGLRAPGLVATVHAAAVASDARPAGEWHAEWPAFRGLVRLAVTSAAALPGLIAGLEVEHDAVARNLGLHPAVRSDPELVRSATAVVVDAAVARFRGIADRTDPTDRTTANEEPS